MKCFIIYNKHEITTHVIAENTIIVQASESDDIFTFKQLTARNTHVSYIHPKKVYLILRNTSCS